MNYGAPMSQRDDYPPGAPCWVETIQPDLAAAGAFYSELFGWELVAGGVDRGDTEYLLARLRGRDVAGSVPMPPMADPAPQPGWVTHVRVERVEDAADRVRAAGGTVILAPFDAAPAGRMGVMADPSGAVFCVWEPSARQGAQLVNEPGAWAMSRLDTPEPDRCAAFYGEVFGWTTETFPVGDDVFTMFRLPGYVGGEPEQPVSREVVATMAQAPGPARWHVDFWVADVDEAAATAARLGGSATVEPYDMPMGRSAVLADAAGATFSVTCVKAPG
jgi:predicted enzyme related to lactoylglutathione lyase